MQPRFEFSDPAADPPLLHGLLNLTNALGAGSAEPPSMEALLADDSCACSEAMMAAATSAGTSSRRIAPGRTMVVVSAFPNCFERY